MMPWRQRGSLIIAALVVVVVIGTLGAVLVSLYMAGPRATLEQYESARALFVAESGLEYAAERLHRADDRAAECLDALDGAGGTVGQGQFELTPEDYINGRCHIESVGIVGNTQRRARAVIRGRGDLFANPLSWAVVSGEGGVDASGVMTLERVVTTGKKGKGGQKGKEFVEDVPDTVIEAQDPGQVFPTGFLEESPPVLPLFDDTDEIYWATDLIRADVEEDPGLVLDLETDDGDLTCRIDLVDDSVIAGDCTVADSAELDGRYNFAVRWLGGVHIEDITLIRVTVDWADVDDPDVDDAAMQLRGSCLGTARYCMQLADPAEPMTWDEVEHQRFREAVRL